MEAIRQIVQVKNGMLSLELPPSFVAQQVEVIVLPAETLPAQPDQLRSAIRQPSPKLKGSRILGDIMAPVIPESDWDVLK
jgi:hypothetical protein